jgi:hypothetical protein
MKYVRVRWNHALPDEPILLSSELDDQMWETRKVEVYADGRADFANHEVQSGSTKLGIEPYPTLEEIAADPQFEPTVISAEEFVAVWKQAKADGLARREPL